MLVKEEKRIKRHRSIRKRILGSDERPRLSVHRSLNHLYVQAIDDIKSVTLCAASTAEEAFTKGTAKSNKTQKAEKLGQIFAKKLKDKGIAKIAFDRAGCKYHGRIKALAESLRKEGINF